MPLTDPLAMSPATVTFSGGLATLPFTLTNVVTSKRYSQFPPPWQPLSGDPGILVTVTNNASFATIAPILVDVFVDPYDNATRYSPFAEMTTVGPGQTVTEIIQGIPVTQMLLCLYNLSVETSELAAGWTVAVQAWRI